MVVGYAYWLGVSIWAPTRSCLVGRKEPHASPAQPYPPSLIWLVAGLVQQSPLVPRKQFHRMLVSAQQTTKDALA